MVNIKKLWRRNNQISWGILCCSQWFKRGYL